MYKRLVVASMAKRILDCHSADGPSRSTRIRLTFIPPMMVADHLHCDVWHQITRQPLSAMRPKHAAKSESMSGDQTSERWERKNRFACNCEVRYISRSKTLISSTLVTFVVLSVDNCCLLLVKYKDPHCTATSPFLVQIDVVDRIAMARMRCTAPIGMLLMLACSIIYVMARDQVDVAGLPVEVGWELPTADSAVT